MVSHKLKDNLFFEKIGNITYRRKDNNDVLNSVVYSSKFPYSIDLTVQVDLFNVKPETEYMLIIISLDKQLDQEYQVVSRFVTKTENMLLNENDKNIGNIVLYYDTTLSAKIPKDKVLHCMLMEVSNQSKVLDDHYTYLTFVKEVTENE